MTENHYYNKELNIDGTADELYIEVRNGYREDIEEIDKISEILLGEGKTDKAMYCLFEIESIRNKQNNEYFNFAAVKQDYLLNKMDNPDNNYPRFYKDDIDLGDNIFGTIEKTPEGSIAFYIQNNDDSRVNYMTMPEKAFLDMTEDDIKRKINELLFYSIPGEKEIP